MVSDKQSDGLSCSVCKCGYLAKIMKLSFNFFLLIEDDGRALAFFFGLIGMHLGG